MRKDAVEREGINKEENITDGGKTRRKKSTESPQPPRAHCGSLVTMETATVQAAGIQSLTERYPIIAVLRHDYSHLIDEETEAQKHEETCPASDTKEWKRHK